MLFRVFKQCGKLIHFIAFCVALLFHLDNFLGKLWDIWDEFLDNFQLSLSFFEFKVYHFDLFFLFSDLLLSIFKNILLNVRLFVQNTKFVIPVNKLDTHIISAFTCLFILVDQVVHFLLQRVDDQIEFVRLVNFLADNALLRTELVFKLVKFCSLRISHVGLFLYLVFYVNKGAIFFSRFVSENFNFILKDFNTLFHFSKILT